MKPRGARVLGPYEQHNGWRVISVGIDGRRENTILPTEAKARRFAELLAAELDHAEHTTATALDVYAEHMGNKGNKPRSVRNTSYAIRQFFPTPLVLASLTAKRCQGLYDELRERPTALGKPPAVDSHRFALNVSKTFLEWCVERGFMRDNPLAGVKGIGRRRPRGKSLGKSGAELRVKGARAFYTTAIELATAGDQGATAALMALLLGLRANEITGRMVGDVDSDEADSDTLWIPCSKTPAGRRTLEVPEVLRPLLLACCEGKTSDRHLFVQPSGAAFGYGWVRDQVHRVCDRAGLPRITAHALRGLLATLTAERGLAGHLIAATLGHESTAITERHYMAPGAAAAGVNRRGLTVLRGGAQAS